MGFVPQAIELGTEAKRGLRAGVQAESYSLVVTFLFRQRRGEVLAGVGGQFAFVRSGRRPKEGSQRMPEYEAGGRQLPMASIIGQVARASRLVTISECSLLTNDVRLDAKLIR